MPLNYFKYMRKLWRLMHPESAFHFKGDYVSTTTVVFYFNKINLKRIVFKCHELLMPLNNFKYEKAFVFKASRGCASLCGRLCVNHISSLFLLIK